MSVKDKFTAANTTLDGRLTKEQAEAAGLKSVAHHFGTIDEHKAGYITLEQLRAFRKKTRAEKEASESEDASEID